ncbi:hypothetical protein [Achromobacter pestifer]|uniref:Uncharacterized protein n=1 Tax=Achromobacter pestifer TaxID=1353889 RepID=A0A6S6YVU5_9BURK|nr:hypothetical protein [Achromobacter pestifer]CAB3647599.1 hypothetical protein LMG3431_02583 [Achromobacter pestifer]
MKPRRSVNPKRKLRAAPQSEVERGWLDVAASKVAYGGNPEHKRNPGDFGLQPPAQPRQGKSLCDHAELFRRSEAVALLRTAFRRGLVSIQERNGWPQNVWAVAANGVPLEAMLENAETGTYHGYPMLPSDPLIGDVLARWEAQ